MSKTNCVNCGAAKDIDEIKCPFCGTTYLDFTAIDFNSHDPVVCQFVLPFNKQRTIMSMVAIPQLNEISMISSPVDITAPWDGRYVFRPSPPDINVEISFIPVERDGKIFTLKTE